MKSVFPAAPSFTSFLLLLPLLAPFSAAAEELPAQLEVDPNSALKLTQDTFFRAGSVSIMSGPVTIYTQNQGFIFDSAFEIETADGKNFKFKIPKADYAAGKDLTVDVPVADTGQGIAFHGIMRSKDLDAFQEMESESCSKEEFGYSCGAYTPFGKFTPEFGCGLGTYSVDKKRDVIVTKKHVEEAFAGTLKAADGSEVAKIHPVLKIKEVEVSREHASACGEKAPEIVGKSIAQQSANDAPAYDNTSLFPDEDKNGQSQSAQ